jgi:5,10-methylene-tetrahydrofolate dehydrogenase/methenyl tetrahydrofolate cyclohydrolase
MNKHLTKILNIPKINAKKNFSSIINTTKTTLKTKVKPKTDLPLEYRQYSNKILNGSILAQTIKEDLKQRLSLIMSKYKITQKPKLKIILIGERKDSRIYVENKVKACKYIGVDSELKIFNESVSLETIKDEVSYSNSDPDTHGIIVQLPVPLGLEAFKTEILSNVAIEKDVDGLNPLNQGRILQMNLTKTLVPPTAVGVLELLRLAIKFDNNIDNYIKDYLLNFSFSEEEVDLSGLDVCVLGRGLTAGLPISILMQKCNGTVTLCHSLSDKAKVDKKLWDADIIISAVGKKSLLTASQIKRDSIIIDVGINVDIDPKSQLKKVCGDVDFGACVEKARFITPVPGGVGKMTVVMLIKNVIKSWIIENNVDLNEINNIHNLCFGHHNLLQVNSEEIKDKIYDMKDKNKKFV